MTKKYRATVLGKEYTFESIKEVLAKANEPRQGDIGLGIAARTVAERVAAKKVLSELTIEEITENPVIEYEKDEVTRWEIDSLNKAQYHRIRNWTIGEFREWLLDTRTKGSDILAIRWGLIGETAAAVAKIMSNMDLMIVSKKINVVARCNNTCGLPGTFGARLQPNHPTDDWAAICAEIKDGLSYCVGDAVIGINPVKAGPENTKRLLTATYNFIREYNIPTQNCVLSHITDQMKAIQDGAPCDLMFQSLAGNEATNRSFGINIALIDEAYELMKKYSTSSGPDKFYWETGEGTEQSAGFAYGVDQLTWEARKYALARRWPTFMLDSVVGFIGPEYLYDLPQLIRACLENLFCGKLLGIPMGLDTCYTFHMNTDGVNDEETMEVLSAVAGAQFLMSIPGGDDIMLFYGTTSHHDNASIRWLLGLRPYPEFEEWCEDMGLMKDGQLTEKAGDPSIFPHPPEYFLKESTK